MELDWELRTALKFVMLEDLVSQLYAARFASSPEPFEALRRFAELVQTRLESSDDEFDLLRTSDAY